MNGTTLDVILLVLVVIFGMSGYRQGFIVGALSFAGFIGGGMLGVTIGPPIAQSMFDGGSRGIAGIAIVLVVASLGQMAGTALGGLARRNLTWHPARTLDSVGGAVVSGAGVFVVAWLLATAVAQSSFTSLVQGVNRSRVLQAVDGVMPDPTRVVGAFRQMLDQRGFPAVFANLGPDRSAPVPPPDPAIINSPAVRSARNRVLKITGVARACSRRLEGTGFVFANDRVMTNAHVVAGVATPEVEVPGRGRLPARVVVYDPGRDVAVLYVPSLRLAPLQFAEDARSGANAIVAGYPENGPFTAVAARVRERIPAVGRDIYDKRQVRRDVYSLRTRVRPGNSGGPLLAPDGRVYGVIFAAAADDSDTGYALTADEVASDARRGASATNAVSTQTCD